MIIFLQCREIILEILMNNEYVDTNPNIKIKLVGNLYHSQLPIYHTDMKDFYRLDQRSLDLSSCF